MNPSASGRSPDAEPLTSRECAHSDAITTGHAGWLNCLLCGDEVPDVSYSDDFRLVNELVEAATPFVDPDVPQKASGERLDVALQAACDWLCAREESDLDPSKRRPSVDAEPPVVAEGGDRNPQLRGYDVNVFAAWFVIDDAAVETGSESAGRTRRRLRMLPRARHPPRGPTRARVSDTREACPSCGVDFQGKPIPEESQGNYGGATHFSRVIGVYDQQLDRTVAWRCPDCDHEWPRA